MGPIGKNLSEERTVTNASIISRPFLIFTVKKARSKEGIYIYIYRSLLEDESISEMERRKRREIDGRSVLLRVLILVSRDVIIRRNTRERAALIRRIGL